MIIDATSSRSQFHTEEDGQDEIIVPWISRDGDASSTAEDQAFSPPSNEGPESSNQPNSDSHQDNGPLSRGFTQEPPSEPQENQGWIVPVPFADFDQPY
jgi:hypothetical protein